MANEKLSVRELVDYIENLKRGCYGLFIRTEKELWIKNIKTNKFELHSPNIFRVNEIESKQYFYQKGIVVYVGKARAGLLMRAHMSLKERIGMLEVLGEENIDLRISILSDNDKDETEFIKKFDPPLNKTRGNGRPSDYEVTVIHPTKPVPKIQEYDTIEEAFKDYYLGYYDNVNGYTFEKFYASFYSKAKRDLLKGRVAQKTWSHFSNGARIIVKIKGEDWNDNVYYRYAKEKINEFLDRMENGKALKFA